MPSPDSIRVTQVSLDIVYYNNCCQTRNYTNGEIALWMDGHRQTETLLPYHCLLALSIALVNLVLFEGEQVKT